MAGSNNSQRL